MRYILPPPSGNPASLGLDVGFDVVALTSDEAEASGLLKIQSVAFSISPP